jgi:hypothetical protein
LLTKAIAQNASDRVVNKILKCGFFPTIKEMDAILYLEWWSNKTACPDTLPGIKKPGLKPGFDIFS